MLATRAFPPDLGAMDNTNAVYTNYRPVHKVIARREARLCSRLSPEDFLNFDGPTGLSASPGSPRCDFFLHLGLHETTYRHRVLYRKMKSEAKAGMERLCESIKCQQPGWTHIRPSSSLSQITEVAFQQEVERIYNTASVSTKGIYDIVGGPNGNWVIRWMLWRVIQARLTDETRASSSGTDTDASIPVYSPPAEYSLPTPQSNNTSPKRSSIRYSAYDSSDSEDWGEHGTKVTIKPEPDSVILPKPQHYQRRSYWENVL